MLGLVWALEIWEFGVLSYQGQISEYFKDHGNVIDVSMLLLCTLWFAEHLELRALIVEGVAPSLSRLLEHMDSCRQAVPQRSCNIFNDAWLTDARAEYGVFEDAIGAVSYHNTGFTGYTNVMLCTASMFCFWILKLFAQQQWSAVVTRTLMGSFWIIFRFLILFFFTDSIFVFSAMILIGTHSERFASAYSAFVKSLEYAVFGPVYEEVMVGEHHKSTLIWYWSITFLQVPSSRVAVASSPLALHPPLTPQSVAHVHLPTESCPESDSESEEALSCAPLTVLHARYAR